MTNDEIHKVFVIAMLFAILAEVADTTAVQIGARIVAYIGFGLAAWMEWTNRRRNRQRRHD